MKAISKAFLGFFEQFPKIGITDIVDILIVTILFYYIYKFVRERRAGKLAVGILFILIIMMVSSFFKLYALNFIISNIVQVGIIGVIILFQAELRSFLEKVGGESIKSIISKKDNSAVTRISECVGVIADAVSELSADKTGALIVIERGTKLGDVIKTGTVVNADPSAYLIRNIFFNKSPLHDGAMIIRDGRVYAAGCFLPLSQTESLAKTLGTRHRAAMGISENSDAAVVVVSEETGTVSFAIDGKLTRGISKGDLIAKLEQLLLGDEDSQESNVQKTFDTIGRFLPIAGNDKNDREDKADKNGTERTSRKNGRVHKNGTKSGDKDQDSSGK